MQYKYLLIKAEASTFDGVDLQSTPIFGGQGRLRLRKIDKVPKELSSFEDPRIEDSGLANLSPSPPRSRGLRFLVSSIPILYHSSIQRFIYIS